MTTLDNRQPTLALNQTVALSGIFPSSAGNLLPLGAIRTYAFTAQGNPSADTNGHLLQVSQNQVLFSLLGTTFGGNGTTLFALPNLDGRIAVGQGSGPGLSSHAIGQSYGVDDVTLTLAELPTNVGGSGQPIGNSQASLAVVYGIAVNGFFPGRDTGSATHGFIGEVAPFAVSSPSQLPDAWLPALGQFLPISQYGALFDVIGTTYGGDGIATFALPDLRGRAIVGTGSGVTLGEQIGTEQVVLTQDQLPSEVGGAGQPFDNVQPSLGMTYLIATEGIFPDPDAVGNPDPEIPYLGEIVAFAGSFAPQGYHFADGSLLPIAGNESLFQLLGTTYGGNGTTNFALPNLRGRAVVDESATRPVGSVAGSLTETVVLSDLDGLPELPPVAVDDSATTNEGTAVLLANLLANDMDLNGDALSIVSVDGSATMGSVVLNPDGSVTYDPGSVFDYLFMGHSATDSFT